jgi:ABC-type iron transport system FetAB permease component
MTLGICWGIRERCLLDADAPGREGRAALSLFEAGWMLTYVVSSNELVAVMVGALAAAAITTAFVRRWMATPPLRSRASEPKEMA